MPETPVPAPELQKQGRRVVWVSDNRAPAPGEAKILSALSHAAIDTLCVAVADAQQFRYQESDLIVLNAAPAQELAMLSALQRVAPQTPVLVRSDRPTNASTRPYLDPHEGPELTRARILYALERDTKKRDQSGQIPSWRHSLRGDSRPIRKVAEIIRLVGPRRCTVLITGETGTGKEVAARAIHNAGPRSNGPFVALNCSAVPGSLLEAELFGHTRGAFTGAVQTRIGRVEQAEDGTLFLDEIGDLPLDLQAKLLRLLQEREFQRLGSSETQKTNARIVAATNCDLRERILVGAFREDLFYRLNVVPLQMPALRDRKSDVKLLGEYFLQKICTEENLPLKRLTPQAWGRLDRYSWPGNVRQLENAVCSAVVLSDDRLFLDEEDFDLPPDEQNTPDYIPGSAVCMPEGGVDFTQAVNALERDLLTQALKRTGGNKKAAAEMLRLKRTTLTAKARVLDIRPEREWA